MKKACSVTRLCSAFDVARSTYYDWAARQSHPADFERQRALAEIKAIHKQTRASYGRRRMSMELHSRDFYIGPFQARSLMRQAGVNGHLN